MANPRQRRKAKSSTHNTVSHSKRAKRLLKTIRGPKVLQDAWNPSKTVRQNYVALGLEHNLNPIPSGGCEVVNANRTAGQIDKSFQPSTTTNSASSSVSERFSVTPALTKGFGRIIRDSDGNVIRLELPSDDKALEQEPVVDVPVRLTESELRIWAHDCPATERDSGETKGAIVQDLEDLAACATVRERYTSLGERLYLERLVKKYGDDLDKMARDRRLNPLQRTANELRRAIAKAGGFQAMPNVTE